MSRLNVDLDFLAHPKTKRLIALIGKRGDIFPIRMWTYLGKFHAKDGRFTSYSAIEIEGLLDWDGAPGVLIQSLVKTGFLDVVGEEFKAHDWEDHEGHIHAWTVRGKNNARKRWGNASRNANSNAPSLPAVPTVPDQPTKDKDRSMCATEATKAPETSGVGLPLSDPPGGAPSIPTNEPGPNQGHSRAFQKPTVEEVGDYIKRMKYSVDPVRWWNHYESNGWMVGRNKMKNWRAAVVTWSREGGFGGKQKVGGRAGGGDGLTDGETLERRERLKRLSEGT